MTSVVILDSGVANLASVRAAFDRLGAETIVTADPPVAAAAVRLVLPGVGAFGVAAEALRSHGLDDVVRDALARGTPLLAICLGLQVLCEASDESPGVRGIGLIPARCRRLPAGVRVPHLGWNRVAADPRCRVVASGDAAFANSYCLDAAPSGWACAWTTHGMPFVAALERASLAACQFHPELSGAWGLELLRRWLTGAISGASHGGAATGSEQRDAGGMESRSGHMWSPGRQGTTGPAARASGLVRRIVPCLDVRDGRVVKGVRFQDLRDAGDPAVRAAAYESQGADEIVLLDIAASPNARETRIATVREVRAMLGIPLTVGGGVRGTDDARRLLAAGADKVSVNTAAVQRPALVTELASEFGSQCIVAAIDARRGTDGWDVLVNGGRDGTGLSAVDWAARVVAHGAGEILLTSWDRDGTRAGCDLELLRAVSNGVSVPVIASGGVGSRDDVMDAIAAGADAVLAASIFHDGSETVAGLKADLALRGIPVRTSSQAST